MTARTTQVALPNSAPATKASRTPKITPTLRSTPLMSDWLTLGCTTRSAAIVAKIGAGCSRTKLQLSQAAIAATEVLSTWRRGPLAFD